MTNEDATVVVFSLLAKITLQGIHKKKDVSNGVFRPIKRRLNTAQPKGETTMENHQNGCTMLKRYCMPLNVPENGSVPQHISS